MSDRYWKVLLSKSLVTCLFGGGAVLAYEIHSLKRRFGNLLSEDAIEREHFKSENFIAIPQNVVEGEVHDMISKFISVEQFMETLVRGPKYLGHDSSNPWHLLRILKSELHTSEHSNALKSLATSNYKVGLSQQIAQACDFKVAVKLARTKGVNLNLFLKPPAYLVSSKEPIEDVLNTILNKVPSIDQPTCASYFLGKAQQITEKDKPEDYILRWDPDSARINHPRNIIQILELYLQALLYLSQSCECSTVMVHSGLLIALWRLVHMYEKETALIRLCVHIIANISQFPHLHLQIFQSGWVGQLAEYFGPDHQPLNLAAGKALANMDKNSRKYGIYDRSMYLFYPLYEDEDELSTKTSWKRKSAAHQDKTKWDIDVIFVHGLLGGVGWTWRQSELLGKDNGYTYCWPRDWLPGDIPGLRILGVDYASSLSHWKSRRCPEDAQRSSIPSRADQVLLSLKLAGVGRRPIVWVGHSMGGLLVKQLLVNAGRSEDSDMQKIVKNTKALLMISVPHGGSSVATLSVLARFLLLPSVEVEELRKDSNVLDSLNLEFKKHLEQHPVAIVSLVETKSTQVQPWGEFKFVEPSSADLLSFGEVHFIPVDHFEICKPLNRKSFVYQRLIKLILGVREGSPPKDLIHTS